MQRWYDCLDHGSPGGAKCAGKLAATGTRDMDLVRAFSGIRCKVHEGQPWLDFSLAPGRMRSRASPERAFSIAWQQVHEGQP